MTKMNLSSLFVYQTGRQQRLCMSKKQSSELPETGQNRSGGSSREMKNRLTQNADVLSFFITVKHAISLSQSPEKNKTFGEGKLAYQRYEIAEHVKKKESIVSKYSIIRNAKIFQIKENKLTLTRWFLDFIVILFEFYFIACRQCGRCLVLELNFI